MYQYTTEGTTVHCGFSIVPTLTLLQEILPLSFIINLLSVVTLFCSVCFIGRKSFVIWICYAGDHSYNGTLGLTLNVISGE
jgi:hypothetical protein